MAFSKALQGYFLELSNLGDVLAVPYAWNPPPLYPHVAGSLPLNFRETSLISLSITNPAHSITLSCLFLNLL